MRNKNYIFLLVCLYTSFLWSLLDDPGNYRPEITRYNREPETPLKNIVQREKEANREDFGIDDRNYEEQMKKEKRIHQELEEKKKKELLRLKKNKE